MAEGPHKEDEPKSTAKKPAVKKPAAKKNPARKPAAKKTTAAKSKARKPAMAARTAKTSKTEDASFGDKTKTGSGSPAQERQEETMSSSNHGENAHPYRTMKDLTIDPDLADKLWRLVGMTAFALIAYFIVLPLIILFAACQFVVVLVKSEPHDQIRAALNWCIDYITDIFGYLSFKTDNMPFPLDETDADTKEG